MIERTTFDLRIAEHRGTVERANREGWARAAARGDRRPALARLAGTLLALARRLDPRVKPERGTAATA